ncbi:hypothetical protein EsH8_III_001483 [Colletotrichum jinshuiense]
MLVKFSFASDDTIPTAGAYPYRPPALSRPISGTSTDSRGAVTGDPSNPSTRERHPFACCISAVTLWALR